MVIALVEGLSLTCFGTLNKGGLISLGLSLIIRLNKQPSLSGPPLYKGNGIPPQKPSRAPVLGKEQAGDEGAPSPGDLEAVRPPHEEAVCWNPHPLS